MPQQVVILTKNKGTTAATRIEAPHGPRAKLCTGINSFAILPHKSCNVSTFSAGGSPDGGVGALAISPCAVVAMGGPIATVLLAGEFMLACVGESIGLWPLSEVFKTAPPAEDKTPLSFTNKMPRSVAASAAFLTAAAEASLPPLASVALRDARHLLGSKGTCALHDTPPIADGPPASVVEMCMLAARNSLLVSDSAGALYHLQVLPGAGVGGGPALVLLRVSFQVPAAAVCPIPSRRAHPTQLLGGKSPYQRIAVRDGQGSILLASLLPPAGPGSAGWVLQPEISIFTSDSTASGAEVEEAVLLVSAGSQTLISTTSGGLSLGGGGSRLTVYRGVNHG